MNKQTNTNYKHIIYVYDIKNKWKFIDLSSLKKTKRLVANSSTHEKNEK